MTWRDHRRTILLVGAGVVLAGVVVFRHVQSPDRRHIRERGAGVPDRQIEAMGALAVHAPGAPPPPLDKDDIFAPYVKGVPKVTTVLSEEIKDGVKVTNLRFASAEGSKEGAVKDCEIYAAMARPANAAGKKLPGILICHGGGGAGGEGCPIAWAKLGYVAIAPDFPGIGAKGMRSITRVNNMTSGADLVTPLNPTPYVCVSFDAVVSGLRAFNLLEAQPDVDPKWLCMTGISMGGNMVTMLSGLLDERVKAVFNLYGSGFYQLDVFLTDALKKMNEADRNAWLKHFDAGTRLYRCRAAYLMYNGTNDIFFKPPSVMATFDAIPGSKYICFGPNKSHYMSLPGGPVRWEYPIFTEVEPAFFAYVLAGNDPPLPEPTAMVVPREGKTLKLTVKNCPDQAIGWFYVSWLPDQPRGWNDRDWARLEAARGKNGEFTCSIPESLGAFDWYGGITFTLQTGKIAQAMSLSTKIYRCGKPGK